MSRRSRSQAPAGACRRRRGTAPPRGRSGSTTGGRGAPSPGQPQPLVREHVAVRPQDRLEVRRRRLGQPDVQEDLARHVRPDSDRPASTSRRAAAMRSSSRAATGSSSCSTRSVTSARRTLSWRHSCTSASRASSRRWSASSRSPATARARRSTTRPRTVCCPGVHRAHVRHSATNRATGRAASSAPSGSPCRVLSTITAPPSAERALDPLASGTGRSRSGPRGGSAPPGRSSRSRRRGARRRTSAIRANRTSASSPRSSVASIRWLASTVAGPPRWASARALREHRAQLVQVDPRDSRSRPSSSATRRTPLLGAVGVVEGDDGDALPREPERVRPAAGADVDERCEVALLRGDVLRQRARLQRRQLVADSAVAAVPLVAVDPDRRGTSRSAGGACSAASRSGRPGRAPARLGRTSPPAASPARRAPAASGRRGCRCRAGRSTPPRTACRSRPSGRAGRRGRSRRTRRGRGRRRRPPPRRP